MTTLADVREALANTISTTGLRCTPYVVDGIVAPMAMVDRRAMDPRLVFSTTPAAYQFRVICLFGRTAERSGQMAMDSYLDLSGERSVLLAVQNTNNWPDDLVNYAQVTQVGDTYEFRSGEALYLAVDLDVEVVW
jgi:hypothetical protein